MVRRMEISRRGAMIGLGAFGGAFTLASCQGAEPTIGSSTTSTPVPIDTPSASPDPTKRTFEGQPSPGTLFYGASLPYHRSLQKWERELGTTLGLHRSYFTPGPSAISNLTATCRSDLAANRVPHTSIKPPGPWAEVAAGHHDSWLAALLTPLGALGTPIFFTLHHEPENDAGTLGMQAGDYVAMQQRLLRLSADLAPSVTIAPVLQHWTFDPTRTDIDPAAWLVPEAPVAGLDVYNPWSPTNGMDWRTFGSKVDEVLDWFGQTPIVIGEYGCRDDPHNPGMAAQWLRDAAEYAQAHNIVSMSYFNSHVGAHAGTWEMSPRTERAFAELLSSDLVARPGRAD